jgi:hypothetical protein
MVVQTPPGKGSRAGRRGDKVREEDDMEMSGRRSNERNETFIVRMPRPTKSEDVGAEANVATIVLPDGKSVHALDRAVFDRAVKKAFEK